MEVAEGSRTRRGAIAHSLGGGSDFRPISFLALVALVAIAVAAQVCYIVLLVVAKVQLLLPCVLVAAVFVLWHWR